MSTESSVLPVISARDYVRRAGHAFACGNWLAAEEGYRLAVAVAPGLADAHAGRALALKHLGRSGESQAAALKALAVVPTHPIALKILARVAFEAKNLVRARKYCECVLSLHPFDAEAEAILAEMRPWGAFDAYVSLGSDCEAGLQFQRIGWKESSFFRYTLAPFERVLALVESDFAGVLAKPSIVPLTDDMVTDAATGIGFHSCLRSRLDPASGLRVFTNDYDFDGIYREERNKARYLAEKWRQLTASDSRVLYLLKYEGTAARAHLRMLRDLFLTRYPTHDFMIVALQTEDRREADWGLDRVINRYLCRFAPFSNTHDSDQGAWDQVFAEFPIKSSR